MPVKVDGLRELERAFARADKHVQQDMRDALAEAAAPVRNAAQALAANQLRPGDPWAGMRVGVSRSVAWVAPVERGTRTRSPRSRPRFGTFLMDRAMLPALEQNVHQVEQRVGKLLDEVADVWERRP